MSCIYMTHVHRAAVSLLETTFTLLTIILLSVGFLNLLGYLFRTPPNESTRSVLQPGAPDLEEVPL